MNLNGPRIIKLKNNNYFQRNGDKKSSLQGGFRRVTMKFINYLTKITGVDIYAMSSFFIFFAIFIIILLWAWRADKKMINAVSNLPLED